MNAFNCMCAAGYVGSACETGGKPFLIFFYSLIHLQWKRHALLSTLLTTLGLSFFSLLHISAVSTCPFYVSLCFLLPWCRPFFSIAIIYFLVIFVNLSSSYVLPNAFCLRTVFLSRLSSFQSCKSAIYFRPYRVFHIFSESVIPATCSLPCVSPSRHSSIGKIHGVLV